MPAPHPVHTLRANLETERLARVEKLAADSTLAPDALRDLATVQAALIAVREAIEMHGPRLGWGSDKELD